MAYRSAPIIEDVIWQAHLPSGEPPLADAVRETIAQTREHLLEFIRLDEPAPQGVMTLAQWSTPSALSSLLRYIPITSIAINPHNRAKINR